MRLSYTQISLFEGCPRKWYKLYIQKLWAKKAPIMLFGDRVHNGIKVVIEGNTVEVAVRRLDLSFLEDSGYGRRTAQALITDAMRIIDALRFTEIETEVKVNTQLMTGVIDVRGDTPNGYYILDWKVTGYEYSQHEIITSDQLTAYAFLHYSETQQIPDWVCYAPLNRSTGKGKLIRGTRDANDLTQWAKKLSNISLEISQGIDRRNPDSCNGRYGLCQFYDMCWDNKEWDIIYEPNIPKFARSA